MVTTIPIRSILERLGHQVDYDEDTGVIRITDPATGRTGTISPGTYKIKNGRAYINPQYISSWLERGLPTASVAAYTALDQIPTMREVIAKAQADYENAKKKKDTAGMQRAQQVINAARMIANVIGMDTRPAEAFNPVKKSPIVTSQGTAFFDPVAYMWQASMSLPWAPGTPTMREREMDLRRELTEKEIEKAYGLEKMKEQFEREMFERQQAIPKKEVLRAAYLDLAQKTVNKALEEFGNDRKKLTEALKAFEEYIKNEAPMLAMAGLKPDEFIDYAYTLAGGYRKVGGSWVDVSGVQAPHGMLDLK